MMFCSEPLVKRAWFCGLGFGCPQEVGWRWVTAGEARFPLRRSAARRYPRPCRAEGRESRPSARMSVSWRGRLLAQTLTGQIDPIGVVNDAVEDGVDQRVRDRIQKVMDLDVIVEIDPRAPPFRELPVVGGQGDEGVALDCLERLASAQAEVAHGTLVHALHDEGDGRVAFGEREERQMAQPP